MNNNINNKMNNLNSFSSSIMSAIITKTTISPLTRIKVLQQLQSYHNTKNYNTFLDSVKYIYKNEGFRGYYKGNMANILKGIPNYCIKFPLNNFFLNYLAKDQGFTSIKQLPYQELLKAGVFTGFNQVLFTYPLDLIRTRVSQDKSMLSKNISIRKCLQQTIQNEGFVGLYRGLTPAIATTPFYIGIQLSTYQFLRKKDNFLSNSLVSGSIAGILSQTLMYPGDTIKRQLQINGMNSNQQFNSLKGCIQSIYSKNGIKGFYRGILLNSLKSIPEVAIKFTVFDLLFNYQNQYF